MIKKPEIIATEMNGIYDKNESISVSYFIVLRYIVFQKYIIGGDEIALTKIKDLPLFCQP